MNNKHHLSVDILPTVEMLHWTDVKPTESGWYWCKQMKEDDPTTFWAAIVRVEEIKKPELSKDINRTFFIVTYLSSPIDCDTIALKDWDDSTLWAGPLEMPHFQKIQP